MKYIKLITILMTAVVLFAACNDDETVEPQSADYKQLLSEYLTKNPAIKGAMASVSTRDENIWVGAEGLAEVSNNQQMDTEAFFSIASLTKPFIATLVLQLVEEGKCSLDDLVMDHIKQDYVQQVPNINDITIKHLLSHTSGVYDYLENGTLHLQAINTPDARYTLEDRVNYAIENGDPEFTPGEGYSYSNTNYVLLGQLVEDITGNDLKHELEYRIFEPLSLENTFFAPQEQMQNLIHGYYGDTDVTNFIFNFDWNSPDGGIYSTMSDLKTFFHALFEGQLFDQTETLSQMQAFNDNGYGLGLELFSNGTDGMVIGHTGTTPGYSCGAAYIEDQSKLVIVVNNQTETEIENNAFLMNQLIIAQKTNK